MDDEYILSRKIKISIERCLSDICEGKFAEPTVKELLIDLREVARQFPIRDDGEPKFDQAFTNFVEICDFLAHANKDRGVIFDHIQAHIEKVADALARGGDESWIEATKVQDVVHGDSIVAGMLGTAFLYLLSFKKELERNTLFPAWERKDEIALCIISILQDSIIKPKKEGWRAILHVVSYEGHYRLYCKVLGSRVEQDARARTGGTGHLIIGFPVIVTNSPDIDGVLPATTPEWQSSPNDTRPPPIVETYRGSDARLHVRLVENS